MNDSLYCHIDVDTEHELIDTISTRSAAEWIADVHNFVPHLVHLLQESHHTPAKQHAPTVRQIVTEHCRTQMFERNAEAIDKQIDVILDAMEQVRRQRLKSGTWSDAPVPPMMFG